MSDSKDFGVFQLLGCFLVDGDPVEAKTHQASKVTHFVNSIDEPTITINVADRHELVTKNGRSFPTSIGIKTNKGTLYTYSQNGFFVEAKLKRIVGTLQFTKEVTD